MNLHASFLNGSKFVDLSRNCSLQDLSLFKGLPIEFLTSRGLRDIANPYDKSRAAVGIPYRKPDGSEHRIRLRTGLFKPSDPDEKDHRYIWDKRPDKPGLCLYALDHLNDCPERIFIVEGETDVLTLGLHGNDALGVPGSGNFDPERDDPHLEQAKEIIVVSEQDEGSKALLKRLSSSRHRDRMRVASMDHFKDVNEMHCTCPELFKTRFEAACRTAVPLDKLLEQAPELDQHAEVTKAKLPNEFRYNSDGHIECLVGEDEDGNPVWRWLCSPLEFLATTRDGDQMSWGLLIRIETPDDHWNREAVSKAMMVSSGDQFLAALVDLGLRFTATSKSKDALKRLFAMVSPKGRATCVASVGWHGRAFVRPDQAIGDSGGEEIVFQPQHRMKHAYRCAGSLEGWQDNVARYAIGNSRLILAISAALAGPLLQLEGLDGGGIHFRGSSSIGKTTLAHAAGSVWGGGDLSGFVRSWRTTDNALEGLCELHSDTLLVLDEIAEIDPRAVGKAAYMLANGQGKSRANRRGNLRPAPEFRILFLSTGEISLADKVAEDRRKLTAGQQVRVTDLPADAGANMGIFENLHGFNRPADLADTLKRGTAKHYGHASIYFLERLTSDLERAREAVGACVEDFVIDACPPNADGQVQRVAKRFGLLSAAGAFASAIGVLPWPKGEAIRGIRQCFEDVISQRGSVGPAEISNGIAQVRSFIEKHGASRFMDVNCPDQQIRDRAGYREKTDYGDVFYIFPETFTSEVCGGFDPKVIAAALAVREMLEPGNDGKSSKLKRLPGSNQPQRVYEIRPKLFSESDDA